MKIFNNHIIYEICKYLDYGDICRWSMTNKYFNNKIKNAKQYDKIKELKEIINNDLNRTLYDIINKKSRKYEKINDLTYQYDGFIDSILVSSFINLTFPLLIGLSLFNKYKFIKFSNKYNNKIKNLHWIKMLRASMTNSSYIDISNYILKLNMDKIYENPEHLTLMLKICITHNNSDGFILLFDNIPKELDFDISHIYELCIMFDMPDLLPYIWSKYTDLPVLTTLINKYNGCYIPKILFVSLQIFPDHINYNEILNCACIVGDFQTVQIIVDYCQSSNSDIFIDTPLNNAYKHNHLEIVIYICDKFKLSYELFPNNKIIIHYD